MSNEPRSVHWHIGRLQFVARVRSDAMQAVQDAVDDAEADGYDADWIWREVKKRNRINKIQDQLEQIQMENEAVQADIEDFKHWISTTTYLDDKEPTP